MYKRKEVIGDATLYLGDCLEILPTLDKVDAVITDPPYFQVKQDSWDNQWLEVADFLGWADRVSLLIKSKLNFNGSLYWFCSPQMAGRIEGVLRGNFHILSNIVWNKGGARKGAAGTGIDVTSLRTLWTANTERIIFAEHYGSDSKADSEAGYTEKCREALLGVLQIKTLCDELSVSRADIAEKIVKDYKNIESAKAQASNWILGKNFPNRKDFFRLKELIPIKGEYEDLKQEYEDLKQEYEDLRRPFNVDTADQWGDIWDFPIERGQVHPTQKPEKLIAHIVKISSKPEQIILDPFMGSGTTGVACMNLGRKFIGIEIEEKYFDIACERITQAQNQGRLFD